MKLGYSEFNLGTTLSALKRGVLTSRKEVFICKTNNAEDILRLLYRKGFIESYELSSPFIFKVYLKYWNGQSLIKNLKLISRPSKRVYLGVPGIKNRLMTGRLAVFSTSKGLLTSIECLYLNIGGEALFEVLF